MRSLVCLALSVLIAENIAALAQSGSGNLSPKDLNFAQPDQYSANSIMPGCREAAAPVTFSIPSNESNDLASFCLGLVGGLSYSGRSDGTMCFPAGMTSQQAVRVVVEYIDGHPERMNENIVPLAIEALRAAWPCKH